MSALRHKRSHGSERPTHHVGREDIHRARSWGSTTIDFQGTAGSTENPEAGHDEVQIFGGVSTCFITCNLHSYVDGSIGRPRHRHISRAILGYCTFDRPFCMKQILTKTRSTLLPSDQTSSSLGKQRRPGQLHLFPRQHHKILSINHIRSRQAI